MNRRGFFSTLGVLLGTAAVAPSIFIPKIEPVVWKVPKYLKLKCTWSAELAQDLMAYHGISIEHEMVALMTEQIKLTNPGAIVSDIDLGLTPRENEPRYGLLNPTAIVTLDVPITIIPHGFSAV